MHQRSHAAAAAAWCTGPASAAHAGLRAAWVWNERHLAHARAQRLHSTGASHSGRSELSPPSSRPRVAARRGRAATASRAPSGTARAERRCWLCALLCTHTVLSAPSAARWRCCRARRHVASRPARHVAAHLPRPRAAKAPPSRRARCLRRCAAARRRQSWAHLQERRLVAASAPQRHGRQPLPSAARCGLRCGARRVRMGAGVVRWSGQVACL